jgi:hypothetical protein
VNCLCGFARPGTIAFDAPFTRCPARSTTCFDALYMANFFQLARTPKLCLAHLKQPTPALWASLGGPLYLNPQPVSFLAALALPGLLPRVALLALRFRLEKYAQHTFSQPRALRFPSGDAPITKVSQGRVIPLLAGARVFPEVQPREWAPPANSSSEGLGNNSETSSRGLNVFTIAFGPTTHYRSCRLFTRRYFSVIPSQLTHCI